MSKDVTYGLEYGAPSGYITAILNGTVRGDLMGYRNDHAVRGKVGRIIDRVFINEKKKTTTVKFVDGTVQTVTCHGDDVFDPVVGVAIAVSSFVFGSKKNFHDVVNRKIKTTSSK